MGHPQASGFCAPIVRRRGRPAHRVAVVRHPGQVLSGMSRTFAWYRENDADRRSRLMPERDGYIPGVPCWVDTSHPDPEKALPFYEGLFGWEFEDVMPDGSDVPYFIGRI